MYVEIFTAVFPFILLAIMGVAIVTSVRFVKRYLDNGQIAEKKLKMEQTEIQNIKQRLDRIEKLINDVR
ncbi:hypothetical protein [Pradoshia sp.]